MSKVTLEYIISPQRGVCPHWKMRFMQSLDKIVPIVFGEDENVKQWYWQQKWTKSIKLIKSSHESLAINVDIEHLPPTYPMVGLVYKIQDVI